MYDDFSEVSLSETGVSRNVYPVGVFSLQHDSLKEFIMRVNKVTICDAVLYNVSECIDSLIKAYEMGDDDLIITEDINGNSEEHYFDTKYYSYFIKSVVVLNNNFAQLSLKDQEKFNKLLLIFNDMYMSYSSVLEPDVEYAGKFGYVLSNILVQVVALADSLNNKLYDDFDKAESRLQDLLDEQ